MVAVPSEMSTCAFPCQTSVPCASPAMRTRSEKALRLGLNDHVHREIGAELGNAERAELTAENILRLDTECLGALEKTHHLGGIERYVFDRIDLRQIL